MMSTPRVFDFKSYKSYILAHSGGKTVRRGLKAQLAKVAECQPTYISQVLHGKAQLSPEQAERLNRFFNHSPDEAQFFMNLLHRERAGTQDLKKFYSDQLQTLMEKYLSAGQRLGEKNTLSEQDRGTYYSSWVYAAIHMALTIPRLRMRQSLAEHFNLPLKRVDGVLEFLVRTGLAKVDKDIYEVGVSEIRINKDSQLNVKHHSNWRAQALESLEREDTTDLHYSAVLTLSREDMVKLKDRFIDQIRETLSTVRSSKEEEVYVYTVDFFNLRKKD